MSQKWLLTGQQADIYHPGPAPFTDLASISSLRNQHLPNKAPLNPSTSMVFDVQKEKFMTITTDETQTKNEAADRAAINRANAQHSTGPRTEAGKQRSRLNAMRHGLTGQTVVLPEDDLEIYQKRNQEFVTEYKPKSPTEMQLVQVLADTAWRLNRVAVLENSLLSLGIAEHEHSVDTDHPKVLTALAMAKTYREQNHVIANLGMHGQRLARLFKETFKQLREIQAERRGKEKEQLQNAAIIMEMHKDQGRPYDPAQDGFVFSPAEIETCIQRNIRLTQARWADSHRPCPPPPLAMHAGI